jgi:DNA-binding transcriptional LysR family regulator
VLLAEARALLESADRAARLVQRAAAPSPQLIVAAKPDSDAGLLPAMLDRYQRDPGRRPPGCSSRTPTSSRPRCAAAAPTSH